MVSFILFLHCEIVFVISHDTLMSACIVLICYLQALRWAATAQDVLSRVMVQVITDNKPLRVVNRTRVSQQLTEWRFHNFQ